jgi:hypothetical protein
MQGKTEDRKWNKANDQDIANAYASQALAEAAEPVRERTRGDDTALPAELARDRKLSFERVRKATKSSSGGKALSFERVREATTSSSGRE